MTEGVIITPSGSIREYLAIADQITAAMQEAYPALMAVIDRVSDTWHGAVFDGQLDIHPVCVMPFMQSNFLWNAGVRSALSGHPIAAFPILRTSIEAAAYTYRMVRSEEIRNAWVFRERSDADRKVARGLLTQAVSDTAKALKAEGNNFGEHLSRIYQATITYGAHPNPSSALTHLKHTGEDDNYYLFNNTCLAGPESENVVHGLVAAIEVGLVASLLSTLAVNDHPNLEQVRRAHSDTWDALTRIFESDEPAACTETAYK